MWIDTIEPDDADGVLGDLYQSIGKSRGGVAHVHRAQSLNPRALKAHLELYKSIVFARSSLPRLEREWIAVVVSRANGCEYCVNHHAETARALDETEESLATTQALADGLTIPESVAEKTRSLLAWARRSTEEPASANRDDCDRLRELGWDDRAILDATLTVAYFNFVNRLVLMTGVDLEEDFERYCSPV